MSDFTVDIERQLSKLGKDIQHFVERISPIVEDTQDFAPACDIVEDDEHYMILLDLPGMSKEEINLSLKDNVLNVRGDRAIELEEGQDFTRRERRHGAFSRSFALPESVNVAEIDAAFKNGVLTITMTKSDNLKDSTSIPIN